MVYHEKPSQPKHLGWKFNILTFFLSWDPWTPRGPHVILHVSLYRALLFYSWPLCNSANHDQGQNGLNVLVLSQDSGLNVFEVIFICVSVKISKMKKGV